MRNTCKVCVVTSPRIALDNVSYAYASGDFALRSVSLTLGEGEIVGVLGPNGAGKSTLVRLAAALATPSSGRVLVGGTDARSLERGKLAREIAFVPQRDEIPLDATALELVLFGRAPHLGFFGVERGEDVAIAERALAECGASELSARRFATLSGGEQKRVAMARALAQQTQTLLLDEPAAFLDIHHQVALLDVVRKRVDEHGASCMLVVHDLNLAAQYCDRLALLANGELLALGTVEEVMTYRRMRDAFRVDVYCGVNELTGSRYFVPIKGSASGTD